MPWKQRWKNPLEEIISGKHRCPFTAEIDGNMQIVALCEDGYVYGLGDLEQWFCLEYSLVLAKTIAPFRRYMWLTETWRN